MCVDDGCHTTPTLRRSPRGLSAILIADSAALLYALPMHVTPHPSKSPGTWHPKLGPDGQPFPIWKPSQPVLDGLEDDAALVTITPGCILPAALRGIAFASWAPPQGAAWVQVPGQRPGLQEPTLHSRRGKTPASGLLIMEGGRVWAVSPSNQFGGYAHTFPKGKAEHGLPLQANAIKKGWEESGVLAEIVDHVGDVERSGTVTRYYLGRRVGGHPGLDMGWASQAVHLVPLEDADAFFATPDRTVLNLLRTKLATLAS